jgi:hypothetical protein
VPWSSSPHTCVSRLPLTKASLPPFLLLSCVIIPRRSSGCGESLDEALAQFVATGLPNVENCSSTSFYNAAKAIESACAAYLSAEGGWTGQANMKISPKGSKKECILTKEEQDTCKEYVTRNNCCVSRLELTVFLQPHTHFNSTPNIHHCPNLPPLVWQVLPGEGCCKTPQEK